MKSDVIQGGYKTLNAKGKGILSIACPTTEGDLKDLKKRFGVYVPRNRATQEKCIGCVFCREVFDNVVKCVFRDWKTQPEQIQDIYIRTYKKETNYQYVKKDE